MYVTEIKETYEHRFSEMFEISLILISTKP